MLPSSRSDAQPHSSYPGAAEPSNAEPCGVLPLLSSAPHSPAPSPIRSRTGWDFLPLVTVLRCNGAELQQVWGQRLHAGIFRGLCADSVLRGQCAASLGSEHGVCVRSQCTGAGGGGRDRGVGSVLPLPPPALPQTPLGHHRTGTPRVAPRCPAQSRPVGPGPIPATPPGPPPPDLGGSSGPAAPLRPLPAPPGSVRPSVPSGPVPPPSHGAPRAGVTEPHSRGSPPPRSRDGPGRPRGALSAELPRSADRRPPPAPARGWSRAEPPPRPSLEQSPDPPLRPRPPGAPPDPVPVGARDARSGPRCSGRGESCAGPDPTAGPGGGAPPALWRPNGSRSSPPT